VVWCSTPCLYLGFPGKLQPKRYHSASFIIILQLVSVLQNFYIYVMALVWTSYMLDHVAWYFDDIIIREIIDYVLGYNKLDHLDGMSTGMEWFSRCLLINHWMVDHKFFDVMVLMPSGSYYVHHNHSFMFLMHCSLFLSLVMCLPLAGGIIRLDSFLGRCTKKLCARHIANILLSKWFNGSTQSEKIEVGRCYAGTSEALTQ
jgi:hypothetical protein